MARIEELKEELEAAQFLGPVTEATAGRLTEADAQAYQQERSTRAEIDWVRRAYVALFPVDAEARRAELETLRRELHLDDPEFTTPAAMRPRTNRADLLSLLEYIAKLSAEAEKNTDPLPATKPIALKWKSATPDLELSFAFPRTSSNDRHHGVNPLGNHVWAVRQQPQRHAGPMWVRVGRSGWAFDAKPRSS